MFYRLSCITADGTMRGYQWRENISQDLFVSIATGTKPLADADAQTRNSPAVDSTFDGSPVYYGHVWIGNDWVNTLNTTVAKDAFTASGLERPGA